MTSQGLLPSSTLLDIGCGALRGGVRFVRYLDDGNYYGIDVNRSLLQSGRRELRAAGLADTNVHLRRTDDFDASHFGVTFDFGIAISLLTHLTANQIIYCFLQAHRVMHTRSRFYFSFFEAPKDALRGRLPQSDGVYTHLLADPFHYTRQQMRFFAQCADLDFSYIGDWGHPRGQQMIELRAP